MDTRRLTKNGRTVEYGVDGGDVVVRDPSTGKELKRVPLARQGQDDQVSALGTDEFKTCMRGCYSLKQGDPWAFALCCADCSTLLPT